MLQSLNSVILYSIEGIGLTLHSSFAINAVILLTQYIHAFTDCVLCIILIVSSDVICDVICACCSDGSRLIYVQSTLRRKPGYRTLEKDLIQLQQQQLFQLFVVVSLRKGSPGNTYTPIITQQFPTKVKWSIYSVAFW